MLEILRKFLKDLSLMYFNGITVKLELHT
jgi:hypothetical protein